MLNIVLFGPPGAGKGTQSEKLIHRYGLSHLSTGELLRTEICNNTELGLEAKKFMDEGQLVPDDVVIGMIGHRLENASSAGFIFDGFPRTVAQAEALDDLLAGIGESITAMIALEVPKQELVDRLVKRGETSGRSDDNEETIGKRITEYENKTRPVAQYYNASGKYFEVNGVGGIDDIFERVTKVVDRLAVEDTGR